MYIILGIIAGILTVISVSLNAELGGKVGVFQGVTINFLAGFSLITMIFLIGLATGNLEFVSVESVPGYAFLGGMVGCAIASSCNIVLPKIPVLVATILMFVGQLLCGLIIDKVFFDTFSYGKCIGGVLIAIGIYFVAKKDEADVSVNA